MRRCHLFISSHQKEFAAERQALRDFIEGDPLLRRFFEVFLFEDLPASDHRLDEVYLGAVDRCDIYIGLFGTEYGHEDAGGLAPTVREFEHATAGGKERLVFIRGHNDMGRDPRVRDLLRRIDDQLIRRRFDTIPELTTEVYASLVDYLARTGMLRTRPFDASSSVDATLDDLSEEKVADFLDRARRIRGYALGPETPMRKALAHLNLLDGEQPTNAAVLLFGRQPQRFLISSEVKCLHFHGTRVRKPIPSYQVYRGTVFELVDQALDFVLSKIARSVGTRGEGPTAPVTYEVPQEAVGEAIVNAIAHRDYTSNASVQVMIFSDRIEVWNPGQLPPPLTPEALSRPHASIPHNPLLAEPLFLTRYIEKAGTGTLDMIGLCEEAGLPAPEFRQDGGQFVQTLWRPVSPVTQDGTRIGPGWDQDRTRIPFGPDHREIVRASMTARSISDLMKDAGRTNRSKFRSQFVNPLIEAGLIEMTIPEKPTSGNQRYRTTARGRAWLSEREEP